MFYTHNLSHRTLLKTNKNVIVKHFYADLEKNQNRTFVHFGWNDSWQRRTFLFWRKRRAPLFCFPFHQVLPVVGAPVVRRSAAQHADASRPHTTDTQYVTERFEIRVDRYSIIYYYLLPFIFFPTPHTITRESVDFKPF